MAPPHQLSFIKASESHFETYLAHTSKIISDAEAAISAGHTSALDVSNMLEWSFALRLDELAAGQIGTRWVGAKATELLDAAAT